MSNSENSNLETITDLIEAASTGVPAPIRKNFFKVLGQLCTAAADVPVAYLEGKAEEYRAVAAARRKLIEKSGTKTSEKITVPQSLVDRATEKYLGKILNQQTTLNDIVEQAGKNIVADSSITPRLDVPQVEGEKEVANDWLNEFEEIAKLKNSADMKSAFSKILSGEIVKPGSYSIRTLRILSQLDNSAAKLFQQLVSCTIRSQVFTHVIDRRVVGLSGNPGSNSLQKFGLTFSALNILQEYGLIISDYNSYSNYALSIANDEKVVTLPILFGNKSYGLVRNNDMGIPETFKLSGVAYTNAGSELFDIVEVEPNQEYFNDLVQFLKSMGYDLIEIGEPVP